MIGRLHNVALAVAILAGCGSSSGGNQARGAGGAVAAGGTATGGNGTGGSRDAGSVPGTAGSPGTGGKPAVGGSSSSGGRGGTGGVAASGGSSVTGGADGGLPPATGGGAGRDAALERAGGDGVSRDAASDRASGGAGGAGGADAPSSSGGPEAGRGDDGRSEAASPPDRAGDRPAAVDGGAPLRIAIPLYIWPGDGTEWAQVAAAGRAVSYIVANAGDPGGPGPSADSTYTGAIADAHQAGQRVVGYVDTSYAGRALATVQAEIDEWYGFYPQLDGIFLDLTPSGAGSIAGYYKPLSDQIRAKAGLHIVVINPGQPQFDEAYMALADIAMSYENPYGSASDGYAPGTFSAPSWMNKYAAERFWHVILEVADQAAMQSVLGLARARNVGHVYVTNHADPPAYARLPTYFADEIAAVAP
jgi:hypothetical protein